MALVLLASALAIACRRAPREGPPAASRAAGPRGPRPLRDVTYERTPARVARGRYLTEGVLQCFLCHSDRDWSQPGAPPIAGRKGAGHVWEDRPWLVSPNLTPDRETGAGAWTDDMLARAIREGIGHDGRVLHPQMWYASFRSLSDEDLASVIVCLRTLEPVRNPLPRTTLPKNRPPLQAPPPLEAEVRWSDSADPVTRGAYLVRVADCTGCHTAFEAPKTPGFFGGGNLISFGRAAPVFSANITPDASGIGYYDAALFREVLRTGRVRARTLSSAMPWIVSARCAARRTGSATATGRRSSTRFASIPASSPTMRASTGSTTASRSSSRPAAAGCSSGSTARARRSRWPRSPRSSSPRPASRTSSASFATPAAA